MGLLEALSDDVVRLQAKYDLCTIRSSPALVRQCQQNGFADTLKRLHEFKEMAMLSEREKRYYNRKKKCNKSRSRWGGGVLTKVECGGDDFNLLFF